MDSMRPTIKEVMKLIENNDAYVRLRSFNPDKYPNQAAEILLENRIWFTSIRDQDDIFEGNPLFRWRESPTSLAEIRELVERQMRGATPESAEMQAQKLYERVNNPDKFREMCQRIEQQHREMYNGSSILSFFKDVRVQRNWAEYADRGRGYALIYDFSQPWAFEAGVGMGVHEWVPFEVRYVPPSERPVIELAIAPVNPDDAFRELESALITKSNEWSLQCEERLIRTGIPQGHVTYPAESLRAIAFGYDIANDNREHLNQLLRQRSTPLVAFQVSQGSAYHLELNQIDY